MPAIQKISNSFGYYTSETVMKAEQSTSTKQDDINLARTYTVLNVVGYIPIIGAICGIIHIILGILIITNSDDSHLKPFAAALIVRGSVEFLTLGCLSFIIFIIPDLITTIARQKFHVGFIPTPTRV